MVSDGTCGRPAQCRSAHRPGSHLPAYRQQPMVGRSPCRFAASDLGRETIAIALSFAPGHADAHCVQGMLYSAAGQLEDAAGAFEQALAMDRSLAIAHGFAGYNAALLGRAHETLPAIDRAMRLDPATRRHSIWFFFGGFAELLVGRVDRSIVLFQRSLERNPSYGSALLFLVAALSLSGRSSEAAQGGNIFPAAISGLFFRRL